MQIRRSLLIGNLAMVAFLTAQVLDGAFTYLGVSAHGLWIEANPIMVFLMDGLGYIPGLVTAKVVATGLGMVLHLLETHSAITILAAFYWMAAVVPWTIILFF